MAAYKSHHYVPQMYMRLFSKVGENCVGVYVIDREKFIPRAPIRGQACQDYFYGKDSTVERALGAIEARAARIFSEAIEKHQLPSPGSEAHEGLIFYLGIQHARTVGAAEEHNERSEKLAKALLRQKAELEGDRALMKSINTVRIRRTNAVSEVIRYVSIAASLLKDLRLVLVYNDSDALFISSDAPVVLHNKLYEGQGIGVVGYASVGLQVILPLGPRVALLGYDTNAYIVERGDSGVLNVTDAAQIQLFNDLQWEAAHAVLLASPDTSLSQFRAVVDHWTSRRKPERVVFREEIVERSSSGARSRVGCGHAPSSVALDLDFMRTLLPAPSRLGPYEMPPVRDPVRVSRVDKALKEMKALDSALRSMD